jgi:glycosyltransferase involved in cell wall biosynthesis
MKLLVLTQYYPPEVGAPQTRLSAMARALLDLGHRVEVLTGMPNYPVGRIFPGYRGKAMMREILDGVSVRRSWLFPAMGAGVGRLASYASFSATSVLGLVGAAKPSVVFVESPPLTLVVPAAGAARAWSVPLIVNVADLWPATPVELGLMSDGRTVALARRLESWAYRRADVVTAVTQGIGQELRERGVDSDRSAFLPNGVDTDRFGPHLKSEDRVAAAGLDPTKPLALYVGTIGYVHGLDVVLDAAEDLRRRAGVQIAFVGDGSERERLERSARDRGLDAVRFLGPMPPEAVAPVLASATVALSCLRDLPMMRYVRPSKLLPAMASGVPVVYSGRGEGAEMVTSAEAGVVTDPGDGVALADAIEALAHDRERAARLGANGRSYVERHLTWERLVSDWLEQLRVRGIS